MDLGSSIRRRRSRSDNGSADKGNASSRARSKTGTGLRVSGLVLAMVLGGFGLGYVVATEVVFPTPAPPPALQDVPDLRGLSMAQAQEEITAAGLALGETFSVRHPSVPSGAVLGQSPLPGQGALPEAPIHLTLSLGPEVRPVPDVSRLRGDRAATVLAASGFTVLVDSIESDEPAGRVTEIDPPPGTELGLPGEVRLAVSLGPPPFSMPDLIGMAERDAMQVLDSLGLVVSEVMTRLSLRDHGSIIEQDPSAEVMVELGSAVRLTVGESPLRRRRDP